MDTWAGKLPGSLRHHASGPITARRKSICSIHPSDLHPLYQKLTSSPNFALSILMIRVAPCLTKKQPPSITPLSVTTLRRPGQCHQRGGQQEQLRGGDHLLWPWSWQALPWSAKGPTLSEEQGGASGKNNTCCLFVGCFFSW